MLESSSFIIGKSISLSSIDDTIILNSIIDKEEDLIKRAKFVKDRLKCDVKILEIQLSNPVVSRSAKKNIRVWLDLKRKQINEI